MKILRTKNGVIFLFMIFMTGCGSFLNPFSDAFLDWNNNYVREAHIKQIESYCKENYQELSLYAECLRQNGLIR